MYRAPEQHHDEMARTSGFSDGVFAIACTLLVLDLKVPSLHEVSATALAHALAENWISYVAYVAAFAQILIMWVNHHGLLRYVVRPDPRVKFANGFLLLMVSFVPFPTALVSAYLETPAASVAAAAYAGTFVLVNIAYNLLWLAASHHRRLLVSTIDDRAVRAIRNRHLIALPIYVASVALAFVRPWLGLVLANSLWLLWARMAHTYEGATAYDDDL